MQLSARAAFPPGDARDDWSVLRALSGALDRKLPFDSLAELRARLYQAHPQMAGADTVRAPERAAVEALAGRAGGDLSGAAFVNAVSDFYMSNPIARASRVMAECAALRAAPLAAAAE